MSLGRVYEWSLDPAHPLGGRVAVVTAPLRRLSAEDGANGLSGRYVHARNGGALPERDPATGAITTVAIGDAQPDREGNFLFEPGRGGGRMDKLALVGISDPEFRARYVAASHFGEVNTYFHVDRIAAYVADLLAALGAPSLPPVVAVASAHHAATEADGVRDGVRKNGRWLPFQGGHYRLPSHRYDVHEHAPLSADGEIHLGPGWRLVEHGALVEAAGGRYRANASHNAGIIYHEYGHHIARHTADFRANALHPPDQQDNRKTAMDEGTCDYWTAAMLGTPHIWAWHRRHDAHETHPRSLTSQKTMAAYDDSATADPHTNGTIWGAALWDLRTGMAARCPDGGRRADLLVLKGLLFMGQVGREGSGMTRRCIRQMREPFSMGLTMLLTAEEALYAGQYRDLIGETFAQRGIFLAYRRFAQRAARHGAVYANPGSMMEDTQSLLAAPNLLRHVTADEIPATADILSGATLEARLNASGEPPPSVIVVGDIMLGGRARQAVAAHGPDYPFAAILPLLRRAPIVLGNLEGPFARFAARTDRRYSYRVHPKLAMSLARAGINVVTLANNHLLDCGPAGVVETLDALACAGVAPLGAARTEAEAHTPVIRQGDGMRIGLLGYYWNRRCAASEDRPGCATDSPDRLQRDICALREQVDRVVVTFHWGVPYERVPADEDRAKAHLAVDCGADAVIGHHPHIIQPFEVYRACPIFYSVGNFAFGSGNSRAEGIAVGLRFEKQMTTATVFPLYIKNRDPRVDYQPKALGGDGARRILDQLRAISGENGPVLRTINDCGVIALPRGPMPCLFGDRANA
ncbi:MAG: CapA family protein [Thermomicrobiales bacterium]